ncbi:MAG: CobW family GTP-binding protein [Anaerocolumna sp.]
MKETIDLYLISGFLGSGKTTFLQRVLEDFEGKRVGVIVNEFGSIGIDGAILEKDGIQLVQINNGSIFCSCLKGEFVKTLIAFSKEAIDVLFIENSGMADPSNMHHLLGELEDKAGRPYNYLGAVCILDAVTFLKHVQVLSPVQNQIAISNFIVINKIDLVNKFTIDEVKAKVRELNPAAYLYETMYSEIPIQILEEHLMDNGYMGETSNQPCNRMVSYSVECEEELDRADITEFIKAIQSKSFRIKGFVKTGEGWLQIDVVGDYMDIKEGKLSKWDVIAHTKLVVIGKDENEFLPWMLEQWNQYLSVPVKAYE